MNQNNLKISNNFREEIIPISSKKLIHEQIQMIEMSEIDILNGCIISQNDLDKTDLEWLLKK